MLTTQPAQLIVCRSTVTEWGDCLPLPTATVASFLRIDESADELDVLTLLILSAAETIETYTQRALSLRTIVADFSANLGVQRYEHLELTFPFSPCVSVTEANSVDTYGNATLIASDTYRVLSDARQPDKLRIWQPIGMSDFRIEYQAGYATPTAIPAALRMGLLQLSAWLYEHRGDVSAKDMSPVEQLQASGALSSVHPYRVMSIL